MSSELTTRLAVILHADVAGSTALVQQNDQLAHARIRATFERLESTILKYHGQVRELRGDALLAEFQRASDAVTAALAFQAEQSDYLSKINDKVAPTARIGIAMGEVVIADDTITGSGVVLAQRIEQIVQPGGVGLQGAAYETIPGRFPFEYDDLGERAFKGFEQKTRIYSPRLTTSAELPPPRRIEESGAMRTPASRAKLYWTASAIAVLALAVGTLVWLQPWEPDARPTPAEQSALPLPAKPSIAVLPFENLSGDPNQEYFADGITEDLTTDLSRISGLFVVSRNASFSYKQEEIDVRVVAEELGVRYLLKGSVRRVNDQIRINAQLIDSVTGGHIWANRFDGTMANVFALQDDVNNEIVAALEIRLTVADQKVLSQVETSVPEAYDTLLRGVQEYNALNRDAMSRARRLFQDAVQLDPQYARALANLALTYAADVNFNWTDNREESIRLGLEAAGKALALDDSLPQIYLTRSLLYLSQRQYSAAIEAGRRTIEVHPDYADGHAALGFVLSYNGDFEAALEAMENARRVNPRGTGVYLAIEGRALFHLRRFEEGLAKLESAVLRDPAIEWLHLSLDATYAAMGRLDDAAWSIDEDREIGWS